MPELTRSQYAVLTGLGFAVVAALLLVAAAILRGQSRDAEARAEDRHQRAVDRPPPPPEPPPAPLRDAPPQVGGRKSAEPADLLALVDADQDAVTGFWTREGATILSPKMPFARLQLPYYPPEEYELSVTVTRTDGRDSLNLGLVFGARQGCLVLDGTAEGGLSGLDQIGGKWFRGNPTTAKGRIFTTGKPCRIVVGVRRAAFTVEADGRTVLRWDKPDYDKVNLTREWAVWTPRALFVASYDASYRFEEIRVTPLGGEGYLTR
jgi:hypothetical protein